MSVRQSVSPVFLCNHSFMKLTYCVYVHIHRKFLFFFLRYAAFELTNVAFVSPIPVLTTPLKPHNRISWIQSYNQWWDMHIRRKSLFDFFLGVMPVLTFEKCILVYLLKQFVSATSQQPLKRISRNTVVNVDILCECVLYSMEILIWLFFYCELFPLWT